MLSASFEEVHLRWMNFTRRYVDIVVRLISSVWISLLYGFQLLTIIGISLLLCVNRRRESGLLFVLLLMVETAKQAFWYLTSSWSRDAGKLQPGNFSHE